MLVYVPKQDRRRHAFRGLGNLRVSRAVGATPVSAVVASPGLLRVRGDQAVTHVAIPPDSHARLALEH